MRVKLMMQTEGIIQLLTGFCHFSMRLSSFYGLVLSIFNESNFTLLTFCCCPKSSRNVYLHIFHCWMRQFWHNLVNEIEIILLLNCKWSFSRAKNEENVKLDLLFTVFWFFVTKLLFRLALPTASKRRRDGSLDLETGLEPKKSRNAPEPASNLTKSKSKSMMNIAGRPASSAALNSRFQKSSLKKLPADFYELQGWDSTWYKCT